MTSRDFAFGSSTLAADAEQRTELRRPNARSANDESILAPCGWPLGPPQRKKRPAPDPRTRDRAQFREERTPGSVRRRTADVGGRA